MSSRARAAAVAGLLAVSSLSAGAEAAWVETRVKAHTATVDVERDGSATVRHEIVLGVRGGPLRDFELQGVDADAEPLGEATVTPVVRYGVPAPIPLVVSRGDDGVMRLEIQRDKGLRTGTYTFVLRYRTLLLQRDKIRRRGSSVEVEWVGPRFADGIDVAKVVFRLPEGPVAPTLPSGLEGDDAEVMGSAFLSSVRHEGGKVEVEIVRPHVARGEPALWRVLTSPKCFDGLPDPAARPSAPSGRLLPVERPRQRMGWIGALAAVSLVYGLLVMLKWTLHRRDCEARRAQAAPLVPLPVGARAALAGAFLAVAAGLGALGDDPALAAFALLVAVLFAALRPPKVGALLRGPGQWLALTDADAFDVKPERARGRFLDAGCFSGRVLLVLLLGGATALAAWLDASSPYHALALMLGMTAFFPIFGTGRVAQLPPDRARASARFLGRLARRLRRGGSLKVVAWARIPDGGRDPDELRLLVRVPRAREGLSALEVGVEQMPSFAGYVALPFVLVRARAESDVEACLRSALWQRGRRAEERVAIFRPALPTVAHTAELVAELVDQLQLAGAPPTNSRKTFGASSSTVKVAVRSPAHAT